MESGFVGETIFPFGVDMIAKDAMNDEDKLLLIFETDCDGLEIAVSNTPYDFARLVLGSTDLEYTVTDGSVRFALSPNPRFGEAENVVDGYARRFSTNPTHMWSPSHLPATLTARFDTPVTAKTCTVYIDTITRAYRQEPFECGKKASPQCAKDFRVEFYSDGVCVAKREIADNAVRKRTVDAPSEVFDEIRVTLLTTWENELPGIYKITID